MSRHVRALTIVLLSAATAASGVGADVQMEDVSFPGAFSTEANGINDVGEIVGVYRACDVCFDQGFLWSPESGFETINVPFEGARNTEAVAINNEGEIVGGYEDASGEDHGFFRSSEEVFATIDCPGAVDEWAADVDDAGRVVDDFEDPTGMEHGFVWEAGICTTIDCEGALETGLDGITGSGVLVGDLVDSDGFVRAFQLADWESGNRSCEIVSHDDPGEIDVEGTNDGVELVGAFLAPGDDECGRGFLLSGDLQRNIQCPEPEATCVNDINNTGHIVGSCEPTEGGRRGFLLPEPSSDVSAFAALLFVGLLAAGRPRARGRRPWRRIESRCPGWARCPPGGREASRTPPEGRVRL